MMESSKPLYNRAIACLCAFMICVCLAVFAFIVPVNTKAESVADQFEDWLDDKLFEGSSFWIDQILQTGSGMIPGGAAVYLGVIGGLNMVESPDSNTIDLNSIGTLQGYYYYSGTKYLCQSVYRNDNYSSADGGISVAKSAHFDLRCVLTASTPFSFINCMQWDSSSFRYLNVDGRGGSSPYYRSITGGGSIFPNLDDSQYGFQVRYDISSSTNLTDNMSTSAYVPGAGYVPATIAGGLGGSTVIINDDTDFNPTFHLNPDGKIPVQEIIDFLPDFNIWILQQYPDIDPDILFVPIVIPDDSDSTDGSGCNCVHNIYVDVTCYYDPEINVYVTEYITVTNNVDIELPSEWVQDYTLSTDPYEVETIPFPTVESQELTFPTLDVEDYEETYGNAIDFWFYVAQSFIEKLHLQLILAFAFVLSVVGFILWKLGGGGKE